MGKGKRNPLAPKPPLNPYLEFSAEERPRVLAELGNISTPEVAREVGIRWKTLTKEEKKKYEERFRENKEKYRLDKENFEEATESSAAPEKKSKKKDPQALKKPLTAFMEFGKEERPKIVASLGKIPLAEVGRELGRRWRSLSVEEKKTYETRSLANQLSYRKEKQSQVSNAPLGCGDGMPSDLDNSSTPSCSVSSGTSPAIPPTSTPNIKLCDLGFAQQRKFPWHPALKTGMLARGSRVTVTFLGTGQSGIVDKSKWLEYSKEAEDKITTKTLLKNVAFRRGLEQLMNLRSKLQSEQVAHISVQGISFTPQIGGRKFRSLNKDHLQKEEESNRILMEKKMRQEEGSIMWTCRDCDWKGKYSHKAKAHARDCGQRRRNSSKKSKVKKYPCSKEDCGLSFSLRSRLLSHYRYLSKNYLQVHLFVF